MNSATSTTRPSPVTPGPSEPGQRTGSGTGLFVKVVRGEGAGQRNPRLGYVCAVIAALVSGVSVFINSLGVKTFSDPVLYTTLKDGVVGLILLFPLALSAGWRGEYRTLRPRTLVWLVALALVGGSLSYAVFFIGLQQTTAATAAVLNHFEFVLVAVFALVFLRERISPAMLAGFVVILLGLLFASDMSAFEWNRGAVLVLVSTVLFATDFVISRYLLRSLSTLLVMTARMTLGTLMLFAYLALFGDLGTIDHLTGTQGRFVLASGGLLLLFTVFTFTAIRHVPVAAVAAIGTAAPIGTTILQVASTGQWTLPISADAGLAVVLLAATGVLVLGIRSEPDGAHPSHEAAA
jgi:drug/metabolite transporter (DMT)-like permease